MSKYTFRQLIIDVLESSSQPLTFNGDLGEWCQNGTR